MKLSKSTSLGADAAESLAIQALAFLAAEPERLGRFLAVTGIGPQDVRAAARQPQFLAGVLDYLSGEERLLIEFAAQLGIDPADVARACTAIAPSSRRDLP
jgi:Protein of unknown function (DUF3572)